MAIKGGAKVVYFPGTRLAKMINKAGIQSRLAGTAFAADDLNEAMLSGIDAGVNALPPGAMNDTNKALKAVLKISKKTLLQVAARVKYDMDKKPPLIPVDTGALRQAFKQIPQNFRTKNPMVLLGWPDTTITRTDPTTGKQETVPMYAAFVHEMTSPPYGIVNWSRPNSGPKFFEAAIKGVAKDAPMMMANNIKRGMSV